MEVGRDIMLYQRDAMTAHILPRTVANTPEAVIAWAEEEMRKAPAPLDDAKDEKDTKEFDWSSVHDEATVALDDSTFTQHVSQGDTLVDFYASWCPACQALAPVWAEVAKSLPQTRFAKVDVDKGVLTGAIFGIEALPTIALIRGDRYLVFEGDRTPEAIKAFATATHVQKKNCICIWANVFFARRTTTRVGRRPTEPQLALPKERKTPLLPRLRTPTRSCWMIRISPRKLQERLL